MSNVKSVAVVTGASSGLGAELARQLAAKGLTVLAIARRRDRLEALAAEARRAGGDIEVLAVDLADPSAGSAIAARVAELGELAWLVNNAGVNAFGTFVGTDLAEQLALIRLNCEALVAVTGALVPLMVQRGDGIVLNVASVAGFMATPLMTVYGATKAFVLSFSDGLRSELRNSGVRVTTLCPGPLATEIFDSAAPGIARSAPTHEMSPRACARQGIAAAEQGKGVFVPGARNLFDVITAKLAPRALVQWVLWRRGLSYLGYPPTAFRALPSAKNEIS